MSLDIKHETAILLGNKDLVILELSAQVKILKQQLSQTDEALKAALASRQYVPEAAKDVQ